MQCFCKRTYRSKLILFAESAPEDKWKYNFDEIVSKLVAQKVFKISVQPVTKRHSSNTSYERKVPDIFRGQPVKILWPLSWWSKIK